MEVNGLGKAVMLMLGLTQKALKASVVGILEHAH